MELPSGQGCPRCGSAVVWHRLWGLSWTTDPWTCARCGVRLQVDMDRRSNLSLLSTALVCGLLAACFAWSWYAALLIVPGFAAIWSQDRATVAADADGP